MPTNTTLYRRNSAAVSETIIVIALISGEGAEIRVIHDRDGKVIAATVPHQGEDPAAGTLSMDQHRHACLADGYHVIEKYDSSEQ